MITLSLSPSGSIQAFCEAQGPSDRGYAIDLPDDPTEFKREIFKALLMRQARRNKARPETAVDVAAIAKWLEANPPVPRTKSGAPVKQTATLADLEGLF
jgi:hypothetical protein